MEEQARERAEQKHREEMARAAKEAEQARLKADQLRRQQLAKAAQEQADREFRAKQEEARQQMEAKKAAEARRLAREAAEAEERQRIERQKQAEKERKLQRELEAKRVAALVKTALPVTPKKQQEAEKPALVSVRQIKGDLKLVVAGELPVITMTVKAVDKKRPSANRNAKETKVTPVSQNIQGNIHELVIEKAQPGVYTITVEAGAASSPTNFSVRIYEGSARSSTKNLGARPTNKRQVLTKILMPEGVLWDDDSAFTGSMEDSDSITRFNTSNGLVWKEYKSR